MKRAQRNEWAELFWNMAWPVIATLVLNGFIFGLGWNRDQAGWREASFAPPGYAIAIVWILLFQAMGAARWFVLRSGAAEVLWHGRMIVGLMLLCLAYPLYTAGLSDPALSFAGSVFSFSIATGVAWHVRRSSCTAGLLIGLTFLWCGYATLLTAAELALNIK